MNYYVRPIFSKKNKTSNDYKKLGSSNLFFDTIEIITRKKIFKVRRFKLIKKRRVKVCLRSD